MTRCGFGGTGSASCSPLTFAGSATPSCTGFASGNMEFLQQLAGLACLDLAVAHFPCLSPNGDRGHHDHLPQLLGEQMSGKIVGMEALHNVDGQGLLPLSRVEMVPSSAALTRSRITFEKISCALLRSAGAVMARPVPIPSCKAHCARSILLPLQCTRRISGCAQPNRIA